MIKQSTSAPDMKILTLKCSNSFEMLWFDTFRPRCVFSYFRLTRFRSASLWVIVGRGNILLTRWGISCWPDGKYLVDQMGEYIVDKMGNILLIRWGISCWSDGEYLVDQMWNILLFTWGISCGSDGEYLVDQMGEYLVDQMGNILLIRWGISCWSDGEYLVDQMGNILLTIFRLASLSG